MSVTRIQEPKQTSFGSLLFYNGKRREFATENETEEFADILRKEMEKNDDKETAER